MLENPGLEFLGFHGCIPILCQIVSDYRLKTIRVSVDE